MSTVDHTSVMTRPGVTMSMWPWWWGHVSHLTSGADNMKINWTWSHLRRRRREPVCLGESWNVWRVTILLTWGHVWHLTSPAHPLPNTQLTLLCLLPETICYKCYKSLASIGSITALKCFLQDKCDHYDFENMLAAICSPSPQHKQIILVSKQPPPWSVLSLRAQDVRSYQHC